MHRLKADLRMAMTRPSREVRRRARTSLRTAAPASGAQGSRSPKEEKIDGNWFPYSLGRLTMVKDLECDQGTESVAVKH